jgi:hypothetical protein
MKVRSVRNMVIEKGRGISATSSTSQTDKEKWGRQLAAASAARSAGRKVAVTLSARSWPTCRHASMTPGAEPLSAPAGDDGIHGDAAARIVDDAVVVGTVRHLREEDYRH